MKDKPEIGKKICSYTSDKCLVSVMYSFYSSIVRNQLTQLKHKQKILYFLLKDFW